MVLTTGADRPSTTMGSPGSVEPLRRTRKATSERKLATRKLRIAGGRGGGRAGAGG